MKVSIDKWKVRMPETISGGPDFSYYEFLFHDLVEPERRGEAGPVGDHWIEVSPTLAKHRHSHCGTVRLL